MPRDASSAHFLCKVDRVDGIGALSWHRSSGCQANSDRTDDNCEHHVFTLCSMCVGWRRMRCRSSVRNEQTIRTVAGQTRSKQAKDIRANAQRHLRCWEGGAESGFDAGESSVSSDNSAGASWIMEGITRHTLGMHNASKVPGGSVILPVSFRVCQTRARACDTGVGLTSGSE
jgi:hypothetical protein